MDFTKAKKMLDGGFPVKHEKYGTLYPHYQNTASVFAGINGNDAKKVTIENMNSFYIYAPINYMEKYKLVSEVTCYNGTDDWEVVV